ncbi:nitrate/nitrite transporter [Lentibacillus daqui]|uniref:nitrate/nitrite transporter n=1 Tax=Lentibacillus daqui TaxID=2911514 RepID=UPI0022B1A4FA|nr:NarK/NasA family nitrate transporter [Lentibacillus daqui]
MNRPNLQLSLQSVSLIVGFMVWVLISSLMPIINEDIHLTAGQMSLVTAIPVILGSVLRVPIGFYTNRFGARTIFMISFVILLFPVFYMSIAKSFTDLIISGLFLGVGGATFSIGVTSLPKYYPKEKHGLVNGIYAVGNAGTAISTFFAPMLAKSYGWENTVRFYLVLLLAFIVINFIIGDRKEKKVKVSMMAQIKSVYRNQTLWFLSFFYFITFGAFVAFTVYLPNFLASHFSLDPVDAGIRTAGFIVLATLLRPLGGWLADKFNPYVILMIIFLGTSISGVILSFSPTIGLYTFGTLSVAVFVGIGNGTVFKLVPLHFSKQAGIVNGIVSAMGGLGGFFPPIVLTTVFNLTGHYAIGFMALSEFALVSFVIVIYMYYQDRLSIEGRIIEGAAEGIMVTNKHGVIRNVNPAFTRITGFKEEEVRGKTPSVLKSGKHDETFYQDMWEIMREKGYWEGEIWNKRKNGEIYPEWLTISQLNNSKGQPQYYVGMMSDISEVKK